MREPIIYSTKAGISKNFIWNLLGVGLPILVALIAIPVLIEGLGIPRFGILTLAWMIVGYFTLFDFGLGRALTKLVAERLGTEKEDEIPALAGTTMALLGLLGIGAGALAGLLGPWVVESVMNIPSDLQLESRWSAYVLAASMPIVICTTGLVGILEAHHRFDLTNLVRIPLGIINFLGPVLVLQYSQGLFPVIVVLSVARVLALFSYWYLCLKVSPGFYSKLRFDSSLVKTLLTFGGWMTLSNIVGPLMTYLDRFLIGAFLTMTAVAYYTTPYEIVMRLGIISNALARVLFPVFSNTIAQKNNETQGLFLRGTATLIMVLFPMVLIIVTFAYDGLELWLGAVFADNSSFILQLLAVGVLLNGVAQMPFALIQGAGKPDITAKLHLIELPFYLLILWLALGEYGVVGAAVAWVIRAAFDAAVLFKIAYEILGLRITMIEPCFVICASICLSLGFQINNLELKLLFVGSCLLFLCFLYFCVIAAWKNIRLIQRK